MSRCCITSPPCWAQKLRCPIPVPGCEQPGGCCSQIIDPARQVVHGVVNTSGASPRTIVWAPTKNAGIALDANAAGYAPFAGPGSAPAQAEDSAAQPAAAAPAPAPSGAGAAQMLSWRALAAGLVAALLSVVFA